MFFVGLPVRRNQPLWSLLPWRVAFKIENESTATSLPWNF
jgi:hypothetical protein